MTQKNLLVVVDPHSGVPVYRQVMDQVKFHIASGILEPGDELPSTRALSSQLGVNPMTISKAYSYLERDGVVGRRPGRPLIVKRREADQLMGSKLEQLRESLKSSARMANQFGVAEKEAVNVFTDLLREEKKPLSRLSS